MKHHRLTLLAVALVGGLGAAAQAQEANPYSLTLAQSLAHESNVRRLEPGLAQGDDISTTSLRAGVDQRIGRQRLEGAASVDLARFRHLKDLNYTGYRVNAQWDWSTADRIEGELGAQAVQQLYRYDLSTTSLSSSPRNLEQTREVFARARLGVVTEWTLLSELRASDRRYSASDYSNRNLRRDVALLGARYRPSPDLGLTGQLRRTQGQYPDYSASAGADRFNRTDYEALANWQASGSSAVDLRLSWSEEDHSQLQARSANLWSGSLGWRWQPTGKVSLQTRVLRDSDTGNESLSAGALTSFSDAKQTTALELSGTWQASAKIQALASWRVAQRELDGSFNQGLLTQSAKDNSDVWSLGVSYTPLRNLQLGCTGSQEKRRVQGQANGLTYPYVAKTLSCSAVVGWI